MEEDLTIADLRIESDTDSLLPGTTLHGYRIDSVLGQGDYWFTYLATDLNLDRPVIITEYMPCEIAVRDTRGVIHPAAAEHGAEYKAGLECFLTDARKLTGIRHQNIAQALNAFEANNSAYIVVAHEQGKKAEQLFDGSTVAEKELLAFVLPILDGLDAIHASGYIHRYIQPSNIIIRKDGSPVLTGFNPGGGALFNPANTLTKHFPSDFAPIELCFGDSELHGPWTDIFSLGATLYQAVVGVAPLAAIERSRMVVQGGTDPLMSVLPVGQGNYSNAFLKAIDHALGFLPTQRPLTVAAWRKELSGNDSLDIDFVIRPESEHVAKLREDLETHKLRAQEDHKRRSAERTNEEERTVKKLLDLARTAIDEHDLRTAQTRLDVAAGLAPQSDAVASLREELKAREIAVVEQRLVEETRHRQAEETANKVVALGRGRTGNQARPAVAGRRDGKIESIPALNRSLRPAGVPVNTPISNDRVRSAVDPSNETAGGSPPERDVRRRHRAKWLGYSAAIAGIVGLGLSLAWMRPGSFAILYDAADEWLSGNLFRDEPTETIPKPAAQVPVPEQLAPESRAKGREDPAEEPTLFPPILDQHIGNLLEAAKADVEAGRITHPQGSNAIEKYQAVLALKPDLAEATQAIQDLLERLLSAARDALDGEQWDAAQSKLDEAAMIAPASQRVANLRDALNVRKSVTLMQHVTAETKRLQAEEVVNKLVALGRKALDANDMRMAEAHLAQALVILPESDQVTKLRDELDTRKLRAQEALKSRAAERTNEEERTVKKLLDLARKAINEHDLQTARIYVGQAATIRPDSSDVALVRDEIASHRAQSSAENNAGQSSLGVPARRQNTQSEKPSDAVTIQAAASSRFRVQPGETVRFYTEYSLTLPARDKHAYVQATWALLKNGRRIGQEGMDYGFAKPGLNTAATELPLPSWTKSGQYTVEHRVQVGDSFDVARSHFVVAR